MAVSCYSWGGWQSGVGPCMYSNISNNKPLKPPISGLRQTSDKLKCRTLIWTVWDRRIAVLNLHLWCLILQYTRCRTVPKCVLSVFPSMLINPLWLRKMCMGYIYTQINSNIFRERFTFCHLRKHLNWKFWLQQLKISIVFESISL